LCQRVEAASSVPSASLPDGNLLLEPKVVLPQLKWPSASKGLCLGMFNCQQTRQ